LLLMLTLSLISQSARVEKAAVLSTQVHYGDMLFSYHSQMNTKAACKTHKVLSSACFNILSCDDDILLKCHLQYFNLRKCAQRFNFLMKRN